MSETNRTKAENTKKSGNRWIVISVAAVVVLLLIAAIVIMKVTMGDRKDTGEVQDGPEATYDPLQCVELGPYKEIGISLKVTEEDIQSEIENLQEEHAIYEHLDGAVEDGDLVYADVEGYVDGQKADTACTSDYIEIGAGEWPDGFEGGLLGVQTGQTAVLSIPVPAGYYGDEAIDGRDVEYHVAVKYICGDKILLDYNDDFVKSVTKKYKTTKEYNRHLRKKIKKENEEQKGEFAWSEVTEGCKVKTYPDSLMESSSREVLQGYYNMAVIYGCSREEIFPAFGYESEQDFVDTDLRELAEITAKEYLIAQAIAEKEGISYTPEEYESLKEKEYQGQDGNYDTIEAFEADNIIYLENQALLNKVKDWITQNTKFTR